MDKKNLLEIKNDVCSALERGEYAFAMYMLKELVDRLNDWELKNGFEEMKMMYGQMLSYQLKGMEDDGRDERLERLAIDVRVVCEEVCEGLMLRESNRYMYRQRRSLQKEYKVYVEDFLMGDELEYQMNGLFMQLAFGGKLRKDVIAELEKLFAEDRVPEIVKQHVVSGLAMNVLERYDEEVMRVLLEQSGNELDQVRARVIVSLVFIISRYADRIKKDKGICLVIEELMRDTDLRDKMFDAYVQVVRTAENVSITKKIKEDILPEMMKLRNDDFFKMRDDDNDEDELNPHWQENIENSEIGEKLREFGDMQMSGADVFVSTFAQLKNYSFFNQVGNWFMPFDMNNKELSSINRSGAGVEFFSVLADTPQLCNSDKYSFFLTIATMPQMQIEAILGGMSDQIAQMKEEVSDEQWKKSIVDYKLNVRQYVQDLYRFYNLFPYKGDFKNPFDEALNLYEKDIYDLMFETVEKRYELAVYFFDKDCYVQAADMFVRLEGEMEFGAGDYQKMGYGCSKCGDRVGAVKYYEKALMLEPNDVWTLQMMVKMCGQLGDSEGALKWLLKLYEKKGEDRRVIEMLCNLYYEVGDYDNTLKLLYKLDYLFPNDVNVQCKLIEVLVNVGDNVKAMGVAKGVDCGDVDVKTLMLISYLTMENVGVEQCVDCLKLLYNKLNIDVKAFYKLMLRHEYEVFLSEECVGRMRMCCESIVIEVSK